MYMCISTGDSQNKLQKVWFSTKASFNVPKAESPGLEFGIWEIELLNDAMETGEVAKFPAYGAIPLQSTTSD